LEIHFNLIGEDVMATGIIKINGKEYVVGANGIFVDINGKVVGFLANGLVKESGLKPSGPNIVDAILERMQKGEPPPGAPSAPWGMRRTGVTGGVLAVMVGLGAVAAWLSGGGDAYVEQKEAEKRAAEMEKRVAEAKERHRRQKR